MCMDRTPLLLTGEAKEVRILSFSWMTLGSGVITISDTFVGYMLVPIAIKHFNERDGRIIPAVASIAGKCNSTLKLAGGKMYDDSGEANVAMETFVQALEADNFDIIHGLSLNSVRFCWRILSVVG